MWKKNPTCFISWNNLYEDLVVRKKTAGESYVCTFRSVRVETSSFTFHTTMSIQSRSLWGHWRSRSWKATISPRINKPIRRDEGDDRRITDQIGCHFCWIPVSTIFPSQSLMTRCRLWSSSFHSEDQTSHPVTMMMMRDDLHINGVSELCKSEAGVSVWDVKSKL